MVLVNEDEETHQGDQEDHAQCNSRLEGVLGLLNLLWVLVLLLRNTLIIDIVANIEILHVLVCIFVPNVLELLSGVLARIHEQDGLLTRMFKICHIVDFIINQKPQRLFCVVLKNLV